MVNISEGRDENLLRRIADGGLDGLDRAILDVHSDPDHNRSVFTLLGTTAPRTVTSRAIDLLDIRRHAGEHPRLGVVDVVPFVALEGSSADEALTARDEFAHWAATELNLPVFLYGPERTLPEIRRTAWKSLQPDLGPTTPHPTAGAVCVGTRPILIAYNVFLSTTDIDVAHAIAHGVRRPGLRTLAFRVAGTTQVSMNIVDTDTVSVANAYDAVAAAARAASCKVVRAELVGLLPASHVEMIDASRWDELDIGPEKTIEYRIRHSQADQT